MTRHGLEEYVADCVIMLDHRIVEQISTRRLRVVKYRGSSHGTNEYPFLIGDRGISVLPVTSLGLRHVAPKERVPTGIPRLDAMLSGKGYFRGSTILISGPRARVNRALPPPSRAPSASGASAFSTSPSRSRKARLSATCAPSASTSSLPSIKACLKSRRPGPPCPVSRRTSRSSTGPWRASNPPWPSPTPSPTSSAWGKERGEVHAHPPHRFPEDGAGDDPLHEPHLGRREPRTVGNRHLLPHGYLDDPP